MAQGLKLGWAFAWRSLMAAELLFVSVGLGRLLELGRDLNNMGLVIGIMGVIVAVGLLFDRLVLDRSGQVVGFRETTDPGADDHDAATHLTALVPSTARHRSLLAARSARWMSTPLAGCSNVAASATSR